MTSYSCSTCKAEFKNKTLYQKHLKEKCKPPLLEDPNDPCNIVLKGLLAQEILTKDDWNQFLVAQCYRCANYPGSNMEGLETYQCPLWRMPVERRGLFTQNGFMIDIIFENSQDDTKRDYRVLCNNCYATKAIRFIIRPYLQDGPSDDQQKLIGIGADRDELDKYIKEHMEHITSRLDANGRIAKHLLDDQHKSGKINRKTYQKTIALIDDAFTINELSTIINSISTGKYKNIEKAVKKATDIREYCHNREFETEELRKCVYIYNKYKLGYVPTRRDTEHIMACVYFQEIIDLRTYRMVNFMLRYGTEFIDSFAIFNVLMINKIGAELKKFKGYASRERGLERIARG